MLLGVMGLHDFVLDHVCLALLIRQVDGMLVWVDPEYLDSVTHAEFILSAQGSHLELSRVVVGTCSIEDNWYDDALRTVNQIRPDYVIQLSSDEVLDRGFCEDFVTFVKHKYDAIQCKLDAVTQDGDRRDVTHVPPQCVAYRWQEGLHIEADTRAVLRRDATTRALLANCRVHSCKYFTPALLRAWKQKWHLSREAVYDCWHDESA